MTGTRRSVDSRAGSLMVLLCAIWGLTHVAAKLAAPDVSLIMQGGLRAALAAVLVVAWAALRGEPLLRRDGTLAAGIVAGALFAGEFVFIYAGLAHTAASRMVVFVYLAPVLTALGLHLCVPGEQLHRLQWIGVLLAFLGIVAAFGEGFARSRASLLGDAFGVIAAILWAATTVWIRASSLTRLGASKVLLYQLAVCAVVMLAASPLLGEPGVIRMSPLALGSLVFQGAVVAFASYLAWFWLLTRYRAGPLSIFAFLTPLFGVLFGALILGEAVTPAFAGAVVLVGAGIALVNRKAAGG